MNSGAVTGRVYDAVKRELMSGSIAPGARLDPSRLADELSSSATPVRDALYQLVGERLVETRPNEGFFLPHLRETTMRDRYRWIDALLKIALSSGAVDTASPALALDSAMAYEPKIRAIFGSIGRRVHNLEVAEQIASASDRVAAVRHAEGLVLAGTAAETIGLTEALVQGDHKRLRRLVSDYHRRRIRAVSRILAAFYLR